MTSSETLRREGGRRALLFSGHMIDSPKRERPRFPPALEPAVTQALQGELDRLDTGALDVAISSAACGADILFLEAVLARGIETRIHLPFNEGQFLDSSVRFAGERWEERFHAVVARSRCFIATDALGPLPDGADAYERTNLWMLDEARRHGGDNVVFLCVWNGEGGDGPAGTKHMIDAVGSQHAIRIDTSRPLAALRKTD